jgi:hypothetical protein
MSTASNLFISGDDKWSPSKTLFFIWISIVFVWWLAASVASKAMVDIPPTLVATMGLLLGGEGTRDYFLKKIRTMSDFEPYSLSRILFLLGSLVVFGFWLFESSASHELADIPKTVVTVLGLLAGGESTRAYIHSKT